MEATKPPKSHTTFSEMTTIILQVWLNSKIIQINKNYKSFRSFYS